MTHLLFMDESGHDHRTMPYEVRGGISVPVARLWNLVRTIQQAEIDSFGCQLSDYGSEIKGSKLLDKKRMKWAAQDEWMSDEERRKHARGFLAKGTESKPPVRQEFSAYGQACLKLSRDIFQALRGHDCALFASVVPATIKQPESFEAAEYLRKDHVFLLERFFYSLEAKKGHGILVFDQVDQSSDRRFVRKMERYFTKTQTGIYRTAWIVPVPLFVASDMSYLVQAADVCIYTLNWGFRLPNQGMNEPTREDIAEEFGPWLSQLQYHGHGMRNGVSFQTYGIFFVPDPYSSRK